MNSLDRVPQVPQDWANHFIWGGGLGAVVMGIAYLAKGSQFSWLIAAGVTFSVCAGKKLYDYFTLRGTPQQESVAMCVGKTVMTALLPFLFYLATFL